nr:MAG TPA: hypothetical protein [Caudoviricetes sp.]
MYISSVSKLNSPTLSYTSVYIIFPFSYFTSFIIIHPIYILISSTILSTGDPFLKKLINFLLFYRVTYSI